MQPGRHDSSEHRVLKTSLSTLPHGGIKEKNEQAAQKSDHMTKKSWTDRHAPIFWGTALGLGLLVGCLLHGIKMTLLTVAIYIGVLALFSTIDKIFPKLTARYGFFIFWGTMTCMFIVLFFFDIAGTLFTLSVFVGIWILCYILERTILK